MNTPKLKKHEGRITSDSHSGFPTISPASVPLFLISVAAFVGPMRPRYDTDVWWHLAAGKLILRTQRIPTSDPFSWTAAGRPWVAHEWLSEVIFASVWNLVGAAGLLLLAGTVMGVALLFLRSGLRHITNNPWLLSVALIMTAILSQGYWTVRPHLFSFLMLAVFFYLLTRYRVGRVPKLVWILVPLTVFWANLHAQFIVGPALVAIYAAVALLRRQTNWRNHLFLAGSVTVAGMLNPQGPSMYLYPLHVARVSGFISEWQPPRVFRLSGAPFIAAMFLSIIVLAAFGARNHPEKLLSAVAFSILGLGGVKSVGTAAIPLSAAFVAGLQSWGRVPMPSEKTGLERRMLLALSVIGLLAGGLFGFQSIYGKSEAELMVEAKQPRAGVEQLNLLPPGRLFNHYDYGGYLIWKTDLPVSLDGRNDMYGRKLIVELLGVDAMNPGWREYLDERNVQYVLTRRDSALPQGLDLLPDEWELVHEDEMTVLYKRTDSRPPK